MLLVPNYPEPDLPRPDRLCVWNGLGVAVAGSGPRLEVNPSKAAEPQRNPQQIGSRAGPARCSLPRSYGRAAYRPARGLDSNSGHVSVRPNRQPTRGLCVMFIAMNRLTIPIVAVALLTAACTGAALLSSSKDQPVTLARSVQVNGGASAGSDTSGHYEPAKSSGPQGRNDSNQAGPDTAKRGPGRRAILRIRYGSLRVRYWHRHRRQPRRYRREAPADANVRGPVALRRPAGLRHLPCGQDFSIEKRVLARPGLDGVSCHRWVVPLTPWAQSRGRSGALSLAIAELLSRRHRPASAWRSKYLLRLIRAVPACRPRRCTDYPRNPR